MKKLLDQSGNIIADLDDQDRIVNGHHRVVAYRELGYQLFISDGESVWRARFSDDDTTATAIN